MISVPQFKSIFKALTPLLSHQVSKTSSRIEGHQEEDKEIDRFKPQSTQESKASDDSESKGRQTYESNGKMVKLILPWLMYYAIKFNDDWTKVSTLIVSFLNDVMSFEVSCDPSKVQCLSIIIDFLTECQVQDKLAFKGFLAARQAKLVYSENIFDTNLTEEDKKTKKSIMSVLEKTPYMLSTFVTITRMSEIFKGINFEMLSRAVKSNYKSAISYFEREFKPKRDELNKFYYENDLNAEQIKHIVYLYTKAYPDSYSKEEFNVASFDDDRIEDWESSVFYSQVEEEEKKFLEPFRPLNRRKETETDKLNRILKAKNCKKYYQKMQLFFLEKDDNKYEYLKRKFKFEYEKIDFK